MQRSEDYYRRKELLRNLKVPTMSEVTKNFGQNLAQVIFEECPEALEKDLGLKPQLKGAGPNLWISPSDLLIGKVCLTPPLTSKHIKALTHEGIIAIGTEIELKYWHEMELQKQQALEDQAAYLKALAERNQRVAIKMARDEERANCKEAFDKNSQEFEERLRYELEILEQQMLEQQQHAIETTIANVEEEWRSKRESAVQETVRSMTTDFLNDLDKQKKDLEARFRVEFERQLTEYDYAIHRENEACKTTMKHLHHCLECKNLANLMYVLCMERRKCCIERCVLEYKHKTKIDELNQEIQNRDEKIVKLLEECQKRQKQLNAREEYLLEILKQFQKFINYALQATPTQAEFLLNVKKMMLFEITQTMVKSNREKAKHLAQKILPWKSDSRISSAGSKRSKLTLPDYHDCLNEVIPPEEESEYLPAFHYKDKLYVSEELRVMAEKGMDISQTNVLWNRDVENMMRILRKSVSKEAEPAVEESISSDATSEEELKAQYIHSDKASDEIESPKLKTSTISLEGFSKKSVLKYSDEKIDPPLIYCSISGVKDAERSDSKEAKEFLKKIIQAAVDMEINPIETTGLLAAQDSLVKIRESRRSSLREASVDEVETANMLMIVKESLETEMEKEVLKNVPDGSVNFEAFEAIRIPDQLEIKKPPRISKGSFSKPQKPQNETQRESILAPFSPKTNASRESKLLSVKDSLIIHRNSIAPAVPRSVILEQGFSSTSGGGRRDSVISKLSLARDSLELIRKQSAVSRASKARSGSGFDTLVLPSKEQDEENKPKEYRSFSRKISPLTTSHVEIAPIPTNVTETAVNFSPIKEVYEVNVLKTSDSPWKIYECQEKRPSRDNFLSKPNELKVIGEADSREHMKGSTSFTVNRITSIMHILKDDPSLMRLFTSCTK